MSRIGKLPVGLPSGVSVQADAKMITVNGPKGSLTQANLPGIKIEVEADKAIVTRQSDEATLKARHGLIRSLLANMVIGVSHGFERKLEVNGVGYRVQVQGQELQLSLGFSHPVKYRLPQGVQVSVEQNVITISGIDKQKVGQVAAEIRALKKPEPYKGKGIKYLEERIIRKSGKSGKEAAA